MLQPQPYSKSVGYVLKHGMNSNDKAHYQTNIEFYTSYMYKSEKNYLFELMHTIMKPEAGWCLQFWP